MWSRIIKLIPPQKNHKSSICYKILKYRRALEGKINTQEMLYMITPVISVICVVAAAIVIINIKIKIGEWFYLYFVCLILVLFWFLCSLPGSCLPLFYFIVLEKELSIFENLDTLSNSLIQLLVIECLLYIRCFT